MKIEYCKKESFTVIGKEGSTNDGSGFIQRLWADANGHFNEVAHLAKRDEEGKLVGIWGAMSDFSRSFQPWEESFTRGLYLAGIECHADAELPAGWTKWIVPGYEYIRAACDGPTIFADALAYLQENQLSLAGAVHDFTDPGTGKNYMYFPVRRL
ncbi:MAG: AraC family transcriptional regulator [Clostridiales bacterium]|nr:AraC family transcriptional regulator [Clostridiales bacterium]